MYDLLYHGVGGMLIWASTYLLSKSLNNADRCNFYYFFVINIYISSVVL